MWKVFLLLSCTGKSDYIHSITSLTDKWSLYEDDIIKPSVKDVTCGGIRLNNVCGSDFTYLTTVNTEEGITLIYDLVLDIWLKNGKHCKCFSCYWEFRGKTP